MKLIKVYIEPPPVAVSYTHLDVYKRQGYLFCGDLWRDGATGQRSRKRVPRLRQCRVPMIGNAVSYTHLYATYRGVR